MSDAPEYDIITAKEKQAQRGLRTRGICFSSAINEQTSDEIGQEARQREFASIVSRKEKQSATRKRIFI